MPASLGGGRRWRGLQGEDGGDAVHHPPATGPALAGLSSCIVRSDGAALLGFILLSGFCFLSVGKCKRAFPAGRHTGGFRANTTGLVQPVRWQVWTKPVFSHLHQYPDELDGLRRGSSLPLCPRC